MGGSPLQWEGVPGIECVAAEELEVPAVGLEAEVEHVAEERDGPDGQIDDEVEGHPGHDDGREPEPDGLEDGHRPDERAGDVPDDGDEPDDRLQPEPASGPGQLHEVLEDAGQRRDPLFRCANARLPADIDASRPQPARHPQRAPEPPICAALVVDKHLVDARMVREQRRGLRTHHDRQPRGAERRAQRSHQRRGQDHVPQEAGLHHRDVRTRAVAAGSDGEAAHRRPAAAAAGSARSTDP